LQQGWRVMQSSRYPAALATETNHTADLLARIIILPLSTDITVNKAVKIASQDSEPSQSFHFDNSSSNGDSNFLAVCQSHGEAVDSTITDDIYGNNFTSYDFPVGGFDSVDLNRARRLISDSPHPDEVGAVLPTTFQYRIPHRTHNGCFYG
jgi:hypothetical protein